MKLSTFILALTLSSAVLSGECTEKHCTSCRQKTGTTGTAGNYCAKCSEKNLSGAYEESKCDGNISIKDCIRVKYEGTTTTVKCEYCKFGKLLNKVSNTCEAGIADCIIAEKDASTTRCMACKKGKKINTAGTACEALGSDTEDANCKYNGQSNGSGKVKCIFCKDDYYKDANELCVKRPDGSDPACTGLDAGNTDNKCPDSADGCLTWGGWYETAYDGTTTTCKKNSQILSALFAFVSLVSLMLNF